MITALTMPCDHDILKCALMCLVDQMKWLYQLSFGKGIFPSYCLEESQSEPYPKKWEPEIDYQLETHLVTSGSF